jgi:hypothetical protein
MASTTLTPKVSFAKSESNRSLTDQEVQDRLAKGAVISNTALSIFQAQKRPGARIRVPYARATPARRVYAVHRNTASMAIEVSDPSLDRSDESAIAINPRHPRNIVAGAVTSIDGQHFNNSAYVSLDGGGTWRTVTALSDVDEGAGIAFDDSDNCYYTSMQGGFNPVCVVSTDGGLTWSQPARFGFGDKTAVAARGKIALCGFDRLNTEACAFTLDGGANWTVHDFTDSGIGTAPLVSYDHHRFYIIYGALDNNLKIYASSDQGANWTGPQIVVPGNAPESPIAGPLSYEGGALTCPGTNVAIDGSGTIHVLYIDSTRQAPMYTFSKDHGSTWSTPLNVNPKQLDPHMWPCLSCNRHGDLQGGSLVYNQALSQYSILRHVKRKTAHHWTTIEADNFPWPAGGPSPGFRIGFGDYFDCDSLPHFGRSVMAWSETPSGQQPWQTWARVFGPFEYEEAAIDALESELTYLREAFENNELPVHRTPQNVEKFQSHLGKLGEKLELLQYRLRECRDDSSPPDE